MGTAPEYFVPTNDLSIRLTDDSFAKTTRTRTLPRASRNMECYGWSAIEAGCPCVAYFRVRSWRPHAADDPEAFKSFFALLQTREKATGTRLEDIRVSSCAVDILKTILNPEWPTTSSLWTALYVSICARSQYFGVTKKRSNESSFPEMNIGNGIFTLS